MFDPILFKKQFPLFEHPENASLIYLDNAASTQKPAVVIDAVVDFYKRTNANANRSSHRLARAATQTIAQVRKHVAQFIGAQSDEEIVFTSGATESLNIIANGLSKQLKRDDEIVLSVAEHHANLVPWQEVAKKTGAKLVFLAADGSGWEQVLNKKTKVISISAASNTLGEIKDLSMIKKMKNDNADIIIVIDASQLIAHKPINVSEIACDYLVFSAHKIYGPSGVGVLYGKKAVLQTLPPLKFGGEMISQVEKYHSEYALGPERFEAGTSPLAAISGLGAALDFWQQQDRQAMMDYEGQLTAYLHQTLAAFCAENPAFSLLTNAQNNIGIAVLSSTKYALADVAFWLDEHDIAVRVGDHCAQPLWAALGEAKAVLRISLAAYNSVDDVDKLLSALIGFIAFDANTEANQHTMFNPEALFSIHHWQKKCKKIVQWGKAYSAPANIRKEENIITACETDLWLDAKKNGNYWSFVIDSDSNVVKGLALLVVSQANGKTKEEISEINFSEFFSKIGLDKYLSQSRINGLHGLLKRIYAVIS